MNTTTIILTVALIAAVLWALNNRGSNKIKTTIHTIENVLNDNTIPLIERIEDAKIICKNTKSIVFYGIYCALDAVSKELNSPKNPKK